MTLDSRGRIYFTDLTGSAVYRIDTSGTLTRILSSTEVQRPNGIQISPDDRTLYIVEANGAEGGARLIRAYDLGALADAVVALSWLAHDLGEHIEALDANPVIAGVDACVAVDALVVPRRR